MPFCLGILFAHGFWNSRKNIGIWREPGIATPCQREECCPRFMLFWRSWTVPTVEPNVGKFNAALTTIRLGLEEQAHPNLPEAPMVIKNLQSLEMQNAVNTGVRVTGMERNGSMQADGIFLAPIPSLLGHSLPGPFPTPTAGDAGEHQDLAAAQAVLRTGRSAISTCVTSQTRRASNARPTVRSKRSSSYASSHRPQGRWAKRSAMNGVRG